MGKVILSINLEYKPFVPVSITPNSMASVKLKWFDFKKFIVSRETGAYPISNYSIEKSEIPLSFIYSFATELFTKSFW